MNLKNFLEAESKNSIIKNPHSELGRSVMSQIKAVVESGRKAGIVIQGTAYWVEKKNGEIILSKMTSKD